MKSLSGALMKATPFILAALLASAAPVPLAAEGPEPRVHVHLPRTIRVGTPGLRLGQVAVVRADEESLTEKLVAIPMGRAPWSKEELVIDRPTVLGRLASHGVRAGDVRLSGAEKVTVTRDETAVKSARIAEEAEAFLEKDRPGPKGCRWRRVRTPDDLWVPAGVTVALEPRLAPHAVRGEAKVEVAAMADGKKLASADVVFRLGYARRHLVATEEIPQGGIVTEANTELRTSMADAPEPEGWSPPYGQVALRLVPTGTVLKRGLTRPVKAEVLVHRNRSVIMRIAGDGFQITAVGLALEDGRPGDFVKVRNIDSKRVVVGRVNFDGTVEPVYENEN